MRAMLCVFLGLCLAPYALPQEPVNGREAARHGPEEVNNDPWIWWKWANFLILAGVLGYLINKSAGGYFKSQKEEIERGIAEAGKLKQAADARAAQIQQRLAGIQSEIDTLRAQARTEMSAEAERIRNETERHLRQLQIQSEQEMDLMTKTARHELKSYSAELALRLAEERIRAGLNKNTQDALVNSFIHDLRNGAGKGASAS